METMFERPMRVEKVIALGHGTLSRIIKRAMGTPSQAPVLVNHRQRIEIFDKFGLLRSAAESSEKFPMRDAGKISDRYILCLIFKSTFVR